MEFPDGFPAHLQPPVDAAIHAAELLVIEKFEDQELWQGAIWACVQMVFFAFAKQVCQAGREGLWTGAQMRRELDRYLRAVATHFYRERLPPGRMPRLAQSIDAIVVSTKRMPEWKKLQRDLREIAELRSLSPGISSGLPKRTRQYKEPSPALLKDLDSTLSRIRAADALGIDVRTIDRWVLNQKLTPVGAGARKRFKVKELKKLLEQRNLDKRDTK